MNAITIYNHYSRSAFVALGGLCALMAFMYCVFLLEAVNHTASRAHAEASIKDLKSKLSDVESRYLAATQALTPARAEAMGFVHPTSVATVYATTESPILTFASAAGPSAR